jgi:hypothetical protein
VEVRRLGGRRAQKPCRQRNAVVGCTPQSSAVLARLLPSIIARAWSNQRSLLCRCAIAVLVSALKVRPQLLQRNRESPCERPQATIARPAQWGQPWLATRSCPLVPKASGRRPRFAPLSVAPPAAEVSVSPDRQRPPSRSAKAPPLLGVARRSAGQRPKTRRKTLRPSSNQAPQAPPSLIRINRYRYKRRVLSFCKEEGARSFRFRQAID